ncbi:MAG TPA: MerR family DNA-binding protein [Fimbriiglobus sp.]|jgi:Cu(I)-responsive transcriptional regulator|nr:MerR family DNA-binding protein [Fimbriiglobus sp.]
MGLTIGQVAKAAGIGVETVRFYERQGVLAPPPRAGSGYRQFPTDAVERLRFVRRAQRLGFTLREVKELLALGADPDADRTDVRLRAQAKIDDVRKKINDLNRMLAQLVRLRDTCHGTGPAANCPILTALNGAED